MSAKLSLEERVTRLEMYLGPPTDLRRKVPIPGGCVIIEDGTLTHLLGGYVVDLCSICGIRLPDPVLQQRQKDALTDCD